MKQALLMLLYVSNVFAITETIEVTHYPIVVKDNETPVMAVTRTVAKTSGFAAVTTCSVDWQYDYVGKGICRVVEVKTNMTCGVVMPQLAGSYTSNTSDEFNLGYDKLYSHEMQHVELWRKHAYIIEGMTLEAPCKGIKKTFDTMLKQVIKGAITANKGFDIETHHGIIHPSNTSFAGVFQ